MTFYLWSVLTVLTVADLATTWYGLHLGIAREVNPVVLEAISMMGLPAALAVIKVGFLGTWWKAIRSRYVPPVWEYRILLGGIVWFGFVVVNNLNVLAAMGGL